MLWLIPECRSCTWSPSSAALHSPAGWDAGSWTKEAPGGEGLSSVLREPSSFLWPNLQYVRAKPDFSKFTQSARCIPSFEIKHPFLSPPSEPTRQEDPPGVLPLWPLCLGPGCLLRLQPSAAAATARGCSRTSTRPYPQLLLPEDVSFFFFFLPHLHTCMNKLPIPVYNHVGFINEGGSCCAVCACSALILGRALSSRSSAASKPVSKAFILSTWGWRLGRAGFFEMN